jgi:NADH:ubiquinone oxidoreductase subunit 4 (subunit M)
MIKIFFYCHLAGLFLLAAGIYLIFQSQDGIQEVNNLLIISLCIGLGLLLVSPYPVVKAVSWMKRNSQT